MKRPLSDLRPVNHRLEERIRSHVILCWLALRQIRITETTAGATWLTVRRELDRLHSDTFTDPAGPFRHVSTLTRPQTDLLAKFGISEPRQIIAFEPALRGPARSLAPRYASRDALTPVCAGQNHIFVPPER